MPNEVVDLGPLRDMQADLATMRALIKKGAVRGYNLTVSIDQGEEVIFLGGIYKSDPMAALKAQLRMASARMLSEEEEPPLLQSRAQ